MSQQEPNGTRAIELLAKIYEAWESTPSYIPIRDSAHEVMEDIGRFLASLPEPAPDLIWVERTWRDVRGGDVVRPPGAAGAQVLVTSSALQRWHVDPRSPKYTPVPLEHEILMVFAREWGPDPKQINPDASVEILTERLMAEALTANGLWDARIATRSSIIKEN